MGQKHQDEEAGGPWLEDEHVTLLEEEGAASAGAPQGERFEHTQLMWRLPDPAA